MRNRQPVYHAVVIVFTATREMGRDELEKAIKEALVSLGEPRTLSLAVEDLDIEFGDPSDLM